MCMYLYTGIIYLSIFFALYRYVAAKQLRYNALFCLEWICMQPCVGLALCSDLMILVPYTYIYIDAVEAPSTEGVKTVCQKHKGNR